MNATLALPQAEEFSGSDFKLYPIVCLFQEVQFEFQVPRQES